MSRDVAGSADKSLSAFRTIGEVAEIVGVAQHVLRFWETQIKQIKPIKRRGRRYYRQEDIALLQKIKTLLYTDGYTVKGVQKTLGNAGKNQEIQADLFLTEALPVENPKPHKPANMALFDEKERLKLIGILEGLYDAKERLEKVLKV